jgi:hypothetical protein
VSMDVSGWHPVANALLLHRSRYRLSVYTIAPCRGSMIPSAVTATACRGWSSSSLPHLIVSSRFGNVAVRVGCWPWCSLWYHQWRGVLDNWLETCAPLRRMICFAGVSCPAGPMCTHVPLNTLVNAIFVWDPSTIMRCVEN